MELNAFLHALHFDVEKVRSGDKVVDFADAPLPYKLYRGLPATSLSRPAGMVPMVQGIDVELADKLASFAHVLWYGYGITQIGHVVPPDSAEEDGQLKPVQMLRRFVPSGGGLYPSELYAYLKVEPLARGIYHYDVLHHRLVLLREGNFDGYLERTLGYSCDMSHSIGVLFVTTMFWKNFFKYNNFAYRLQGLDAGALIGQLIEVTKRFGYMSRVCYQFLDKAVNHLLGLDENEESVYAIIPLSHSEKSDNSAGQAVAGRQGVATESGEALIQNLPKLEHEHYVKSKRVGAYPLIVQMNRACMRHSTKEFTTGQALSSQFGPAGKRQTPLPKATVNPIDHDFKAACRRRYSPGYDFILGDVHVSHLADMLSATFQSFPYYTDIDEGKPSNQRVFIACCAHGVDGLKDGAYLYHHESHALQLVQEGDHRLQLQLGMSMPTVNLYQVPLCFHLISSSNHYRSMFGLRGYRIQQMEIGILLQRLLLSASALGLSGHPLLDYDEGECDRLYQLGNKGLTCLIQVPVGRYRKASRLEGPLLV